jgi:hypothetical protein
MKGMASAPDYYVPPAEGPHPGTVIAATPKLSKAGATMIHIQTQLDGMSEVIDDYMITDGAAKGAGMGKTKLRGLGIDVSSDVEVPDEQICAQLLNRKCIIVLEHEDQTKATEDGTRVKATHLDERTGQVIQLKRATAKGYRMANVGGMQAQAPQMQYAQPPAVPQQQFAPQAPVQFAPAAPPPQQYAPQSAQPPFAPTQQPQFVPNQPQQQFAYQGQPQQYAPQAPAQAPAQAQYAPQAPQPQYAAAQPQYQQAPQGYAPAPGIPAPVQFQSPAAPAPVPWATNPAAPPTNGVEGEKKKRKAKITDEAQG